MIQLAVSITGLSVIAILIDLICGEGQAAKYVKAAYSVIVVITIVSAFMSIINKAYIDLPSQAVGGVAENNAFLEEIKAQRNAVAEEVAINALEKSGYSGTVSVIAAEGVEYKIEKANVILQMTGISNESTNIYISETAKKLVAERLGIETKHVTLKVEWIE